MTDLVFFQGTLMSGSRRLPPHAVDFVLERVRPGSIQAVLFDLGIVSNISR